ncbi:UNVERIFIED_CONTAM: hypothetical protein Sradi_6469300 [Sesamum radiatum]|uniref:Uncharacterized protein n=1 Tax=Sesamum radiatum TaxID=300843 RepID=A0AAW2K4W0_SESRA
MKILLCVGVHHPHLGLSSIQKAPPLEIQAWRERRASLEGFSWACTPCISGCIGHKDQCASRAHCCLVGFGAWPDPWSSALGGGGRYHGGDFALTVPYF